MALNHTPGVLFALALTVGCTQAKSGPLTSVKDSRGVGTDLQKCIQKISGVLLPPGAPAMAPAFKATRTKVIWLERDNAKSVSHASPSAQWQPIVISSSVPEGAISVAFMTGTEEGDAMNDDAALYEIDGK